MNQSKGYSPARKREHDLMTTLAQVVVGRFVMSMSAPADDLRQLGYAAQLARGHVDDPQKRLVAVVKACSNAVSGLPKPSVVARDKVQAEWGAPWHVDSGKLKTELPLYVRQVRDTSGPSPAYS